MFYAAAIFAEDAVRVTGETRHWKHRHFCPTCGGSVFARWDDEIEVHLGTLDEPSRFTPTYESWTVRREDWLPAFAGMGGLAGIGRGDCGDVRDHFRVCGELIGGHTTPPS